MKKKIEGVCQSGVKKTQNAEGGGVKMRGGRSQNKI